ncbi:MAG TPA: NAD-binding protein [Candidatus Limnocylindrales bacterium]|nr:NAD-binding protein [Candidatus Limnocylindrales bacterium]
MDTRAAPGLGSPWERLGHAFSEAARGRHVRLWVLAVLATSVIGTLGYLVFFRWPLSDALYMTVITLTTVGFREVHELDTFAERLWTMLLAVSGVAIIFGSIGIVAEAIISEAASGRREARRMREAVEGLGGHYILCGYGRVGSTVARELVHDEQRFVVIDIHAESLERAAADGHLIVEGDATEDATLLRAGIERARGLITTVDSDANNVYITLSARSINPQLFIVARASAASAEAKLAQAGANRIVSPYTMAGRRAAELAIRPRVADFIDAALSHGNLSFSLEEVEVVEGSPLVGVTVGALRADGAVTLAILQPDGSYEANPPESRALLAGENLITSGSTDALTALRARA